MQGGSGSAGFFGLGMIQKNRTPVLAPICLLLLLIFALPLSAVIQIGADEGFELAKATLCLKGYKLYTEVWNDQPPLHTFLITALLRHSWGSPLGPRLLTVLFRILLLVSFFALISRY